MNIITYTKDVPLLKKILGYALMLFGLVAIISSLLLFFIFIAIGINIIASQGSQVNITNKTYRITNTIFGLHFGKWKPYPDFEYISIFKTKENQTVNVVTASTTFTNDIILLNLFYKGNKHFTVYKTTDKADALKVAEHFKLALDIDILDATEREKVWL